LRRETHMFHLRHGEMTSTLLNVVVLIGLLIDKRVITFTGLHNMIVLCNSLKVLIICYDCIDYYDDFNLFAGISKPIYVICLVAYYSLTLQGDMFLCFVWRFWKISMPSPHIARDLLYWHPCTNNYVLNVWKGLNISGDVFYRNESKKSK